MLRWITSGRQLQAEGQEIPCEAPGDRDYLRHDFFWVPGARLALWEAEGTVVSVLRLEPYRDGLLVNGLVTAREHRRRGHARQLILAVQSTLAPGTKLYSHVDKHNLPSLRVHEACGFQLLRDCARYLDGSVDFKCCTLLYAKNPAS